MHQNNSQTLDAFVQNPLRATRKQQCFKEFLKPVAGKKAPSYNGGQKSKKIVKNMTTFHKS